MPTSKPKVTANAKKQASTTKNNVSTAGADDTDSQVPRKIKQSRYQALRLHKRIKPERPALPGAFRLFGRSLETLQQNWKLFLGISVIYGLLNLLLVRGLADSGNVQDIKAVLDEAFQGKGGELSSGLTVLVYLLGASSDANNANANAGVYQTLIIIVVSLATIWALRQAYSRSRVRIREALYRGTYPFVPFILILLVIGLQLLPLVVGALLYSTVTVHGVAVYAIEKILWGLLFFLLALLSLYMIASSVFALYVVTLPDMTPMKALRSARELVRYRRWLILRKLLFLPLALLVLVVVIMLPIILWLTPVAVAAYFTLTMVSLVVIHSYMCALYRELLL